MTARCRSCDAPIIWAVTKNDKRMPVDAEPAENGNVELVDQGRVKRAIVHAQPSFGSGPLYLSHFVTCPEAETHR